MGSLEIIDNYDALDDDFQLKLLVAFNEETGFSAPGPGTFLCLVVY